MANETRTFNPLADTYVINQPADVNTNRGTASYAFATAGANRAFLKFNISAIPAEATLITSTLRLWTNIIDVTEPGVQVQRLSNSWTETGVTWNNRPAEQPTVIATSPLPVVGSYVEIDIPVAEITTTGDFSFELRYTGGVGSSNFQFRTKEGVPAHPPELVVEYAMNSINSKTLSPIEDGYVDETRPTEVMPSGAVLYATENTARSYIKFNTDDLPQTVETAQLYLWTHTLFTDKGGVRVRAVDGLWDKLSLTANDAPVTGEVLNDPKLPVRNGYTVIDIDPRSINTTSTTSFEITYTKPDASYSFASAWAPNPPKLVYTFVGNYSPPDIVPTPGNLPFNMRTTAELRSSPKKVFAHYFPPYPISLDNAASNDYYDRNYLNPAGEGGIHSTYGGLLRDRPIFRPPIAGDYELADMKTEIQQAIDAGIDGFAPDILSITSNNWTRVLRCFDAATAVDPGFKVMIQPDMYAMPSVTEAQLAAACNTLAKKPSALRLSDGRLVISPFKAEGKTHTWWGTFINIMETTYNEPIAFWPCFLNWTTNAPNFDSISYGFSKWGDRSPASNSNEQPLANTCHTTYGKPWMQPVSVQDIRPCDGTTGTTCSNGKYDEAQNLENLRVIWNAAIDGGSDWVLLPTWNDYSECTSFAPSADHGWTFLDVNAYYLEKFKFGVAPTIVRDAMYLTHRTQFYAADPSYAGQTILCDLRSDSTPAKDTVEVMSFLTAPATITINGNSYNAPAGVYAKSYPLTLGTMTATLVRNGVTLQTITSPYPVVDPPYVQDLSYYGVASRRT